MASTPIGLSQRGIALYEPESVRKAYDRVLLDTYDPKTNPNGLVNLSWAENHMMLEDIATFMKEKYVPGKEDIGYGVGPWGNERLRKAMAKHMTRHFHPVDPIDPENITFVNGVTSLGESMGWCIADPGDAVLFTRPVYNSFKTDFGLKGGVKPIFVDFDDVDPFSTTAVGKYEAAILAARSRGTKVRAILLCHPHNPSGNYYPRNTIIALMKLCTKYSLHFISDEIYALSVYDTSGNEPFESVLSFDTSPYIDKNFLHVQYGMSKDFACAGLRLGCLYTRNQDLLRAMSPIARFSWPSGPTLTMASLMLEDEEWFDAFLAKSRKKLATSSEIAQRILTENGIKFLQGPKAGFFVFIDLSAYLPEVEGDDGWEAEAVLGKKMLDKQVSLSSGAGMSAPEPGWFRLCFSQEPEVLEEGMRRLLSAIKS